MNSFVGVVAPSDLVGSFLVKILHSVEGGDIEQGFWNLETNLPCLRLLSLSLSISHLCLYLAFFLCLSPYLLDILYLNCYMLGIVWSHSYSTKRIIAVPQLLSRGILRR